MKDDLRARLLDFFARFTSEVDVDDPFWDEAAGFERELASAGLPSAVKKEVWETVSGWYRNFFLYSGRKEPEVTVGFLREYFDQAHMPKEYHRLSKKEQRRLIRRALNELTEEGKLQTSTGVYRGKDARMWDVPRELLD